jgi:hypothetical protein
MSHMKIIRTPAVTAPPGPPAPARHAGVDAVAPVRSEAQGADRSFRIMRAVILLAAWHWVFVSSLLGVVRGVSDGICAVVAAAGAAYCLGALHFLARSHRRRLLMEFETGSVPHPRIPIPVALRIAVLTLVGSEIAALLFLGTVAG